VRYYRIEIGGSTPITYTSHPNGTFDPNSLQVDIDIPVVPFATPMGQAMVRVHGISLQTISQARDLNGAPIKVYGGMQAGLPLAKPMQSGLLCEGTIFQAFGNWIGTEQTLDLIIVTDGGATQGDPKNLVLNWTKGQVLSEAIQQTLQTAYPAYKTEINISPNLVLTSDASGYYQTIEQLATSIHSLSTSIIGGSYPGVNILLKQGVFVVYDGTSVTDPTPIDFTDLIGQPTWIDAPSIQINTVMRADLEVGDYIKLPTTLVTTTAASLSQARDKSAFQGVFQIDLVRHVGSSRQPDARSWISTFNAHPTGPAA